MALWKYDDLTLEDILLHCMPEDVWEGRPTDQLSVTCAELFYPKRPILPTDTERLLFHAPLVNKLIVGLPADGRNLREWEPGLSKEVYEAIGSVLPQPVFVNLCHLIWYTGGASLSHFQQYLSPSLSSLELILTRTARPHISLLSDLADRCPFVTSFNLDTESYNVEDNDKVKVLQSRLIRAWDLHSLESDVLDHSSLIFLSQSSHLTQLITSPAYTLRWIPLSLPHKAFASLCYLHLGNIDMRLCLELFQASTFTAMGRLSLCLLNPAPGDWKRLYAAIQAAHAQPHLLCSLNIEEWDCNSEDPNIEGDPVTDDHIMPLLDFTGMRKLSMRTFAGFDLIPATIERMATAWPAVEMLSLRSTFTPYWQPRRLTLYALVPLAMQCPNLCYLELEMDGTDVSIDQIPPHPNTLSPLSKLSVLWSPIHDSHAVASFLSIYFPQLATIHFNATGIPCEHWRHVRKLVMEFSNIGDHENMEAVDD
ncbi:hypothetical protein BD626DRAFT_403511 [Schizophyllum amplum]|uniref:F-box domain-containing protein n=1 Tax=Schizophyllum amplum TaxID=97359 RepID=A0A550CE27_9AGAR|nr:hypothetical protein BD626DRAFT_403511 [Auriculariopsis ampla]